MKSCEIWKKKNIIFIGHSEAIANKNPAGKMN